MQALKRIFQDFRHPTTLRIGTTVTIGYGTLYYAIAVFAPIVTDAFSVGLDVFFGIVAIGLFIGGLLASIVGKRIDNKGARGVLAFGSVLAALSFSLMAIAPNIWVFATAIILMEIAGCMVLYEAAFAGLTQNFGTSARRYISAVTLIGGFASTIFWPMTQFLVETAGWRSTYLMFAALHLLVCLPLNLQAFRGVTAPAGSDAGTEQPEQDELILNGDARKKAIILFAAAICISGAVLAVIPVHILIILQNEGMLASTAALVAMIIGPAQVLARLVEMGLEAKYTALATGRVCLTALPLSLLILIAVDAGAWNAVPFAIFYGVAQGLANIVRGNVPLQLFGTKGYGALNGKITRIRIVLTTGAPFTFAALISLTSMQTALWLCLCLATLAAAAFWLLRAPEGSTRQKI